jgi:hypothetical protein
LAQRRAEAGLVCQTLVDCGEPPTKLCKHLHSFGITQLPVDYSGKLITTIKLFRACLGTWSKNYWADGEKVWIFLNQIFSAVRILSFNVIHSVINPYMTQAKISIK